MTCPKCNGKVKVTDTVNAGNEEIYRRKMCLSCGLIFYTAEFQVDFDEKFKETWNRYCNQTKYRHKKQEKRNATS